MDEYQSLVMGSTGHTFIREAVLSPLELATPCEASCREYFEPNFTIAVPCRYGLADWHLGHVDLIRSLMPWLLVVVYGHLAPSRDGEDALGRAGLITSYVGAIDILDGPIVLGILGATAGAPLRACDPDIGEVVWISVS